MSHRFLNFLYLFCAIVCPLVLRAEDAPSTKISAEKIQPDAEVSFERDIRPMFKAACAQCHGEEEELSGGLDVRLRRLLIVGGDSGASVVPGNLGKSYLLDRVKSAEMPPEGSGHPLSEKQIALLEKWIKAGAPTLRSEPTEVARGMLITEEDRSWWSFQPVIRPDAPQIKHADRVRSPLDNFILSPLEAKGFSFSADADRKTLIRRAYIDLLGVLPTPEQVHAFENDAESEAWERLIDSLLADKRFGERWGRHWLDVAGYADSEGVSNTDPERKWSWKYRDYVIEAFNDNKPYDQFLIEQLAGDELVEQPHKELAEEEIAKLTATGFLRMAPDGTMGGGIDQNLARNQVIADTMQIVGSSILGLTVNCAQCHEHRYDPIPQADYYRLRAVFDPAFNWKEWKKPAQRQISLYTEADRAAAAELEKEAKVIDAERIKIQNEHIERVFQQELAKLPEEEQPLAKTARETNAKERTDEQKKILKKYPSLNVSAGSLYLYDKKAADELKKMAADASAIRAKKPQQEFLRALTETPGKVPASFVFYRGDHEQPKEEVQPNGLTVLQEVALTDQTDKQPIPANNPDLPTTGRRLAYAKYITNGKHPLTSRVMVNRIWLHLTGRGIVDTPGDFGKLGAVPTHPRLLDWLADEFVTTGWDMKAMIKQVMLSTTYRQSLLTDKELIAVDPDNTLFGGARMKRLEAEVLRDTVLAISGKINDKPSGPPIPVMADLVGQWVIGKENLNAGRPGARIDLKGEEFRRSVYVQVRRSRPLAVLETFDSPRMEPNCAERTFSTVAPQSLMLMNGMFVLDQSDHLATRLKSEIGDDQQALIRRAWELIYSRTPSDSEIADAEQFLTEQLELLKTRAGKEDDPQLQAIASLCQVLLSSNEFLYVD
jgi:mono/diheme cytochrome c family protein